MAGRSLYYERGIIPARAGFTLAMRATRKVRADHPRSRGVYLTRIFGGLIVGGIIPARAGFTILRPLVIHGRRIIPARAGFTSASAWGRNPSSDHPRSRGVYRRIPAQGIRQRGSSPLARGLPQEINGEPGENRIIPARAGFTFGDFPPESSPGDHPRSRGVYGRPANNVGGAPGSSPLARGLRSVIRR